jgi:hypothetical protein
MKISNLAVSVMGTKGNPDHWALIVDAWVAQR